MIKSNLNDSKKRLIVEVEKDVTSSFVSQMKRELLEVFSSVDDDAWKELHLDLRDCRMIDSMGLNWLFSENTKLKEQKKKFIVRISSPAINRVMCFAGFDKLVILKFRRRKQTR